MNINWYHSKHCKQNIFISSAKYGFYIPADLIFAVENEFKLNSCDVGLTDNGDMVLRFSKYGDGMYKVNMYSHGNAAKVCCMSFLRDNNKAYFAHYYYKRLFDLDKPGETFTILLMERDINVV
jgi:hypothetical protein